MNEWLGWILSKHVLRFPFLHFRQCDYASAERRTRNLMRWLRRSGICKGDVCVSVVYKIHNPILENLFEQCEAKPSDTADI